MKCSKDCFISLKQCLKLNLHFFRVFLYDIYHSCTIVRSSTIDSTIAHRCGLETSASQKYTAIASFVKPALKYLSC